jgi:hypothetical protein
MRAVIEILIWLAASIAALGGTALAAAKLLPPYLVHD